jgi:hypothetical protein
MNKNSLDINKHPEAILALKVVGYNFFMFSAFFQPAMLVVLLIVASRDNLITYPITLGLGILEAGVLQLVWTTIISLFLAGLFKPQMIQCGSKEWLDSRRASDGSILISDYLKSKDLCHELNHSFGDAYCILPIGHSGKHSDIEHNRF